jgi:SAM-dependent methyltransferase
MPEFRSRDPLSPAFWDERFDGAFTPWDRGGVPQQLRQLVAAPPPALNLGARPRVLIPGCGTGYELALLCEAGWDATAIDFAPSAVAAARQAVGPWQARVLLADFFQFAVDGHLDVIYERAFLCAMPRAMWPQVVVRWAQLLPPGACLLGYFFFDNNVKGPPFGIERAALDALLTPHFTLLWEEAVPDSLPVFGGNERWMAWRRKKAL